MEVTITEQTTITTTITETYCPGLVRRIVRSGRRCEVLEMLGRMIRRREERREEERIHGVENVRRREEACNARLARWRRLPLQERKERAARLSALLRRRALRRQEQMVPSLPSIIEGV